MSTLFYRGVCKLFHLAVHLYLVFKYIVILIHDKWIPVTTVWRVLRLLMEERPPDMEGSCEYIE
jgi:hypothetical protein